MDIGDYYSKSINGFTKNPKLAIPTLVGYIGTYIVLIIFVILFIFTLFDWGSLATGQFNVNTLNSMNYANLGIFVILYFVTLAIVFVISCCMNTANIGMSERIVNGETPGLNAGLKSIKKYIFKIMLISILMGLISIVFAIPLILGFAGDYRYGLFPTLTIIGGLISIVLWIVTCALLIFTYQSIIIGKKSVISSIKDSVKVIRKNLLEVLVVLTINFVILACLYVAMLFISGFLGLIPFVGPIISLILGIIVYSVAFPYFTLVLTYLYMDKKDKITSSNGYIE